MCVLYSEVITTGIIPVPNKQDFFKDWFNFSIFLISKVVGSHQRQINRLSWNATIWIILATRQEVNIYFYCQLSICHGNKGSLVRGVLQINTCMFIVLTLKLRQLIITSGRYDTEVINSARIFSLFFFGFFSILCRAARVVEEPAEETTTSGK